MTFTFTKTINATTEQVYSFAQGINIPLKKSISVEETYEEDGEEKTRNVKQTVDKTFEEIVEEVQAFGDSEIDNLIRGKFRAVFMKNAQLQIEQAIDSIIQ